jgi:alpha-1,3-mannosyltransferase
MPLHAMLYINLYRIAIVAAIEYAWNVFPSTPLSSSVLFAANIGLLVGIGVAEE